MDRTWQFGQTWNIPNGLSLSRAVLGLFMPLWWYLGVEALIFVIIWAGVSDGLDGWWARRFEARTPLGVVIDPLADKVFTGPFLLLAAIWSVNPYVWLLFLVNLGYDFDNTVQRRSEIEEAIQGRYARDSRPVTWLSKTKTAALFVFMFAIAIWEWYPWVPVEALSLAGTALVGASWFLNRRRWLGTFFTRL